LQSTAAAAAAAREATRELGGAVKRQTVSGMAEMAPREQHTPFRQQQSPKIRILRFFQVSKKTRFFRFLSLI